MDYGALNIFYWFGNGDSEVGGSDGIYGKFESFSHRGFPLLLIFARTSLERLPWFHLCEGADDASYPFESIGCDGE